jgi:hypothetical protein
LQCAHTATENCELIELISSRNDPAPLHQTG